VVAGNGKIGKQDVRPLVLPVVDVEELPVSNANGNTNSGGGSNSGGTSGGSGSDSSSGGSGGNDEKKSAAISVRVASPATAAAVGLLALFGLALF